ncbi:hypothetical protein DRO53_00310 [Candidatus Bathyarchaeota archaeon]|nr:MAG: hypothetical protein DRO46_01355 [Candidatus Hecatellales archaeon]RLI35769.1 MAG: hypothetical protein DRO53_00310 [Candidatus Bathyarchaeota archaeon]
MAKKAKKGKGKKAKAAKPAMVTIRFKKAELERVREAAKQAGAKNVVMFAKAAVLEKTDAVLGSG